MKNSNILESQMLLNKLFYDFKRFYSRINKENWQVCISSYISMANNFFGDLSEQRIVAGWLAGLCEKSYFVSANNQPVETRNSFKKQLTQIIKTANLSEFLNSYGVVICGKRQPSFRESILPTIERYEIMEKLPEIFSDGVESIIFGGSMSYSPFFGIRENSRSKDFSDIDALIIIKDSFFKKWAWKKLINSEIFFEKDKYIFLKRIKLFKKLIKSDNVDVFSQKFPIRDKKFIISIHFVTFDVFKKMIYADLKKSLNKRMDIQYDMTDFRVDEFSHPCHARHTFNGQRIETTINCRPAKGGGFLSSMPGYIISNGRFYPGVYHTIISTAFLVFYDITGRTKKLVKKFEKILYDEANLMRKEFSNSTYAKAHNRYDIFPPGRFEKGLNSYVSPNIIKKYRSPDCFVTINSKVKGRFNDNNLVAICLDINNNCCNEAINLLKKWKRNALKKAERDIHRFIDSNGFKRKILLEKENNNKWCVVASVPSVKKIIVGITPAYKKNNSNSPIITEEVLIKIITPWEIMRIDAYEKLSRKSKKVYISSIFDKTSSSSLPYKYNVIIPVF
jgi:hypothetical protein